MTSTLTAPPVKITAPKPAAAEPPAVTATAYLPLPGFTLTTILVDHSRTCGFWHRHVAARLDEDDLIRHPPCGMGGPYRLALSVTAGPAKPSALRVRGGVA